jgi:hypothetical protein
MKTLRLLIMSLPVLLLAPFSQATLGEHKSTIGNDVVQLKAAQKASNVSSDQYTVQVMEASGNTIREYANSEGVVFAVSWRGISKPDLTVLFGSYFDEYKSVLEKSPRQPGKRNVAMQTSRMVIRRGGHMRDQRGFAFVPSLVPSGLNLEDLE